MSKRPPAPGKPKLKPKPAPSLPKCKTIYPYDATDVDELSFQPDEIIEIVKEGKKNSNGTRTVTPLELVIEPTLECTLKILRLLFVTS